MTFNFSSISQTSLGNSMEYLQRHFLNHSACFSLEQTTDINIDRLFWVLRYSAHCNGLELLPEPPKNKICYRLRPKYESFSCFPIICSSAIWKSLFLRNSHVVITCKIAVCKIVATGVSYKVIQLSNLTNHFNSIWYFTAVLSAS